MRLSGCFRLLFLYDVAEAIDLEMLKGLLDTRAGASERPFPRRTPQYVRFRGSPLRDCRVRWACANAIKETTAACSFRYYEFGVVVVQLEVPFACDWGDASFKNTRTGLDIADAEQGEIRELAPPAPGKLRPSCIPADQGVVAGNVFTHPHPED